MLHSIHSQVVRHMHLGTPSRSPMHLTLFVPDLLWPDHEHPQAFDFDQAPALARLLSLADLSITPYGASDSWESVLAHCFGFHDTQPPLGALRLLGQTATADVTQAYGRTLLCADPVNLDFIQQSLVLSPINAATLSREAVDALIKSLNDEFAREGSFFVSDTLSQWYFAPLDTASHLPNLAACSRLLGRRIDADESRQVLGREGLHWLNRIQMCLNSHPVNDDRDRHGLPVINSIWPWGMGTLNSTGLNERPEFELAIGDNDLLRGLCIASNTPHAESAVAGASCFVLDTRLADAIAQDDLDAWHVAINALVLTQIEPAMAQLQKGTLSSLTLIAPDAHGTYRWRLQADHKGLRPSWLQRLLGNTRQKPDLKRLVATWSR